MKAKRKGKGVRLAGSDWLEQELAKKHVSERIVLAVGHIDERDKTAQPLGLSMSAVFRSCLSGSTSGSLTITACLSDSSSKSSEGSDEAARA